VASCSDRSLAGRLAELMYKMPGRCSVVRGASCCNCSSGCVIDSRLPAAHAVAVSTFYTRLVQARPGWWLLQQAGGRAAGASFDAIMK